MTGRWFALFAILFAAAMAPAPAAACTIIATRHVCDGPCTPELIRAMDRRQRETAAIAYGREMTFAVAARDASPTTDRAFDLARIMLPAIYPAIEVDDGSGGSCGPENAGEGNGRLVVSLPEFAEQVRARFQIDAPQRLVPMAEALIPHRDACNDEVRRGFVAYLRSALPERQVAELWEFMIRRSGAIVPADGAQPVSGGSLTMLGADGRTIMPDESSPVPHIADRKERAAHYLRHHDNGIALMSAINQYWAARIAPSLDRPADLCPVADAAMTAAVGTLR